MEQERRLLFGVHLDPLRMEDVIERCRAVLTSRETVLLGVLNAAKIVTLRKDTPLRNALMSCDLLLADGQAVVWASKLVGRPLPERVAGIDLFEQLLALAHRERRSIYLLGARPDVLERLEERLEDRYPYLRIVGSRHGYFDDQDAPAVAEEIRRSGADMLFLGMSSPKKEIFLATFGRSLNVPILHGVGGSFDVLAGLTKRAPIGWRRIGMEWAFRVVQEPRRLWWRYLRTNVAFVVLAAREFVRPAQAFMPAHRSSGRQAIPGL
jgi:N-acetylglucosaminyldiphosphoundecaprenol N-acetyl-beta-D-mannosaminyltransferase